MCYLLVNYNINVIVIGYFCHVGKRHDTMANRKKQLIRIIFDVLDGMNQHILLNVDRSVAAADPDEAVDMAFDEMQRQFKQDDIRLTRVRIGFAGV